MKVHVIGAGLAGCEAAYQLAKRQVEVVIHEMKPKQKSAAHHSDDFAELVCSNSLRSDAITNGVGLLKAEMECFDSLIMKQARANRLPAGSALAVDRENFAKSITDIIKKMPNITIVEEEYQTIKDEPTIIATGPLTSDNLSNEIKKFFNSEEFYFFDAAAPIITKDSIDFTKAYYKSRYDKGDADYINCPMNKDEFEKFYFELINAKSTVIKDFEKEIFFEGCMPVEVMAKRGIKTLLYGPLKPVGLGIEGNKPYAVVQLRQDNVADSLYNLVGFQTHLLWGEQKRVFRMIPGLENAQFVRYGVMHRNNYINSPTFLNPTYQSKINPNIFFAGQLTGVEGYIESAASGLLASLNMYRYLQGQELIVFPTNTMMGAMAHYITHASKEHFQPINANFGIMSIDEKVDKNNKKEYMANKAMEEVKKLTSEF